MKEERGAGGEGCRRWREVQEVGRPLGAGPPSKYPLLERS